MHYNRNTKQKDHTLKKTQRWAARLVMNEYRQISCMNKMIQKLQWPLLQTWRQKARLTILESCYKFHNGLTHTDSKPVNIRPPDKTWLWHIVKTHTIHLLARHDRKPSPNNPSHQSQMPGWLATYTTETITIPEWKSPEKVAAAPTVLVLYCKGRDCIHNYVWHWRNGAGHAVYGLLVQGGRNSTLEAGRLLHCPGGSSPQSCPTWLFSPDCSTTFHFQIPPQFAPLPTATLPLVAAHSLPSRNWGQ